MKAKESRPDARAIAHLARNPHCERRIRIYNCGETPDSVARQLNLQVSNTIPPFQRQIGHAFEKSLKENSASKLLMEIHKANLLPNPSELSNNGIINIEEHYGLTIKADDLDMHLEFLAEKTEFHIQKRLIESSSEYLLLDPVLRYEYAGWVSYIRPDFMIALNNEPLFYSGEIKSILMLREDTSAADIDKIKRQSAVEFRALDQAYKRIAQKNGISYDQFTSCRRPEVLIVVRRKRMEPQLIVSSVEAELDFLAKSEEVILTKKRKMDTKQWTVAKGELDAHEMVGLTSSSLCDTCEAECTLANYCRQEALLQGDVSALGEDVESEMPIMTLNQVMDILAEENHQLDVTRELRNKLLDQLDTVAKSGGLLTFSDLIKGAEHA